MSIVSGTSMHYSEWLDMAEKVPVGQKRRVRHGAESTCAMDVYNNADSYSAYCHRCKSTGYKRKDLLAKAVAAPVVPQNSFCSAHDSVAIKDLDLGTYRDVVILLQSKGVSLPLVSKWDTFYNKRDHRLCFEVGGVIMGRAMGVHQQPKWFKYYTPDRPSHVYLQGNTDTVVLTEDLFSAMKVQTYTGHHAYALTGTNLTPAGLAQLLELGLKVVLMLDGDDAGVSGAAAIAKRLNPLGVQYRTVRIDAELDPKDLKPNELRKLLNDF